MKDIKTYFDQNPNIFRAMFCLVAVPILWVAALNAYQLVNRSSEQPFFRASVSRLYVMRDIPTIRVVKVVQPYFSMTEFDLAIIKTGDLVRSINGIQVATQIEANLALESGSADGRTRIEIQRPSKRDLFIEFEVMEQHAIDSIWEIPPTVYAWDVPSGGTAAMAGLMQGDLIYQVGGQQFRDKMEADQLMREMTRGRKISLGILRAGAWLTIEIPLARLTIPFSLIFYQAVGMYWLVTGLFIALARANLRTARVLGMGIFALGVAFMLFESRFGQERSNGEVNTSLLFLYAGLAFMFHGSYYFPRERSTLLRNPWARFSSYLVLLFALPGTLLFGSASIPYVLSIFFGLHLFFRFHYRNRVEHNLTRQRYILIGLAVALLGSVIWWFFQDRLDEHWQLLLRAIPAAFLLTCYIYTISRYRLLGMRFGRSLQYGLASILWGGLMVLIFFSVLDFLAWLDLPAINIQLSSESLEIHNELLDPKKQQANERFILMVFALVTGWLVLTIGGRGYRFLRRKFFRTSYDDNKASHELTSLLSRKMSLEDLAQGVVDLLARLMLLKQVGMVIFRADGSIHCLGAHGFDAQHWLQLIKSRDKQLAAGLVGYKGELCVDYLDPETKKPLIREGIQYLHAIHSEDQLVGCLLIGEKLSEATYRPEDFRFLTVRVIQVAGAIENAFLYEKLAGQERLREQLDIARAIQLSSLPQKDPEILGLDISAASIPALEVGGDYYGYFRNSRTCLSLILGDVSGKGMSAALYMSKMQGIISALHQPETRPHELFVRINPILYREMEASVFVTAIGARIDSQSGIVEFVRAGHLPLFVYSSQTGTVERIQPSGMALGLEDRLRFGQILEVRQLQFRKGDVFLFLSDGLTEAFNQQGECFGELRLAARLAEIAGGCSREIRDNLLEEVNFFSQGAEQNDDQTIVVVKAVGDPS